ncbi:helix-turn-helix domain-containing protein, partial [Fischerella thermalis]|uniref:helix-turn-helix domain-containing protein n=1 Tax=Fischerella thermalis TaxID=372787 RepID=UPI0021552958
FLRSKNLPLHRAKRLAERVSIKQSMGIAPYQYVIQQRVEKSKQLLKQGKVTITDIALQCGFANQSHFTKHFRQITGVTPKAYQQL